MRPFWLAHIAALIRRNLFFFYFFLFGSIWQQTTQRNFKGYGVKEPQVHRIHVSRG